MSRQLTIPTADTQLYAVDSRGGGTPLLFLSGGFGTVPQLPDSAAQLRTLWRTELSSGRVAMRLGGATLADDRHGRRLRAMIVVLWRAG
jgi:hypothetical protein